MSFHSEKSTLDGTRIKTISSFFPNPVLFGLVGFLSATSFALTPIENNAHQVKVKTSISHPTEYNIKFSGAPRVSQLVEQGAIQIRQNTQASQLYSSDHIYWHGASLFYDDQSPATFALLNKVTSSLSQLIQQNQSSDDVEHYRSLYRYLEKNTFKQRIFVELEEDQFLVGKAPNPLIHQNTLLILPKKKTTITLLGDIDKIKTQTTQPTMTTKDYLKANNISILGINSVTVISPNGKATDTPIAYWNDQKSRLIPGSIVFIPYQHLPSEFEKLNSDIVRLLQHQVS